MRIGNTKQTLKISKGLITGMIHHQKLKNHILVSSSLGQIHYVKIKPFSLVKSVKIFKQFATCILQYRQGVFIGSRNGKLAYLNGKDEKVYESTIHTDSITSIIQSNEFIVTTSFDGQVIFLNKQNFSVCEVIDLEIPVIRATIHDNSIYIAGNPSYSINASTFEIKLMKRFDFFQEFNRKLYGCSDQRGLTCVTTNSNSYIPCNFILPMKDRMLIVSDECIGELHHTDHMEWKCHRTKQIPTGTSIVGGCIIEENIILGDQLGKLYKITYQLNSREKSHQKKYRNPSLK